MSAIVAVKMSLLTGEGMIRLLNLAEPAARFSDVVPVSRLALSVMVTVPVAKVAAVPLSVKLTTGAGEMG